MTRRDAQILHIALPAIVSNITVPLLGLVDVTIVGHLGNASYIGAIAVGGLLFNIIYWVFGFLRMGTGGMTSQAFGRRDLPEAMRLLFRSLGVAGVAALALILLQEPVREAAFWLIRPDDEVGRAATLYFRICIWGAPAVLGLYGLAGWYVGMQNSRVPMYIAVVQNGVNIAASLFFVYGAGMQVEGVAFGTLVAQYAGFVAGLVLWQLRYGRLWKYASREGLWQRAAMARFFSVNRDIFLRTLCLAAVTFFFTAAGSSQGKVVLAANTLLMQLFTLFSYVMDGFAYAGEALCGRYVGARNREALSGIVRRLFGWGAAAAVLFTLAYALGGDAFLSLLTDNAEVAAAAGAYSYWALGIPLAGMAAFLWDGVFIGATATRYMLVSMALAAGVFFLSYCTLRPAWGNHALWFAFLCYLFARGAMQTALFLWPSARRKMTGM